MKSIIFSIVILCLPLSSTAQITHIHPGYCKKKDMKIITGKTLPKGYVIMQIGDFPKSEVTGSIEELTKKQINTMKTYCKWRKCCHVFIAFEPVHSFKNFNNPSYYDNRICFYVLAPASELEPL